MLEKITPFLWFDDQAEEAASFYCSIFENSKILEVARYPDGKVLTVSFELEGLQFTALNGGPQFGFTEAISFSVSCENQEEVEEVGKGGVVRDQTVHSRVCDSAAEWVASQGWTVLGVTESPITGPEGNVEFLLGAVKNG